MKEIKQVVTEKNNDSLDELNLIHSGILGPSELSTKFFDCQIESSVQV